MTRRQSHRITSQRRSSPVGRLADGTPQYAAAGVMLADGDRVCCHLCGAWFLSVASHLPVHGWTKAQYIDAFGLELTNPLTGAATHKRRSAALTARQATDPTVQRAQANARARARSGELADAARRAARGRAHSLERRAKTLAALAGISRASRAEASRRRARLHLEHVAGDVAGRFGFTDIADYLCDRLARGMSMAAISREAGLHKDWVSRRITVIAPQTAAARASLQVNRGDLRLRPIAHGHGFGDVGTYLRVRHLGEHRTIAAMATEADVSRAAIGAALRRHGIDAVPHASKRHESTQRAMAAAGSLGFDSMCAYLSHRRAQGMTWRNIAVESGIAETTLRRQARAI